MAYNRDCRLGKQSWSTNGGRSYKTPGWLGITPGGILWVVWRLTIMFVQPLALRIGFWLMYRLRVESGHG